MSDEYSKEFRRQAESFRSLSKLLRAGDPTSKQLMDSAIAQGLAEVCEALATLKEAVS